MIKLQLQNKVKLIDKLFSEDLSSDQIALIIRYAKARQKKEFNSFGDYMKYLERYKVPVEKILLIEKLFKKGLSVEEIRLQANVSYSAAYYFTRVKQRGFARLIDYRNDQAQKKGFKSHYEYIKSLKRKGKTYIHQKQKKFESSTDYMRDLARRKGFSTLTEYKNFLIRQRKKHPINRALGEMIKKRLKEIGKKEKWLADQLGVSKNTVCSYTSGTTKPAYRFQKKLFELLELPYQTTDDFRRGWEEHNEK
ncbi:MAG: hypothetical protein Q8M94_02295 [Ignavibacteria bacterium]|nr:hypothetical protein [Ignavibacteria bacterium]